MDRKDVIGARRRAPKRLVLLSGGLDSAVLMEWATRRSEVAVLEFERPDRPRKERQAAAYLRRRYQVRQAFVQSMPRGVERWARGQSGYIPGRNLYFHAVAHLVARASGCTRIVAGHLGEDAQEFPDASSSFFRRLESLFQEGRGADEPRVRIELPFGTWDKVDVVRQALQWGVPIERTWSCQRDGARPCGRCTSCRERAAALTAARAAPPARA